MAKGKYHEWLEPDGLVLLKGWARDGLKDAQIAHNMGITTKTLYEWKRTYSDICEALKGARRLWTTRWKMRCSKRRWRATLLPRFSGSKTAREKPGEISRNWRPQVEVRAA